LLQQYTLPFTLRYPRQAVPQVQSTLAKMSLCRTAALGGRKLKCESCEQKCMVYNSCGDRHCPRCGGAKRADWLARTELLLLPQVNYFQVVFTLPDTLSGMALGNRRAVYALLMRTAWRALKEVLREKQGIEPAALMVLHTWNQELDHHPHIHALVPGGGPSLAGNRWLTTRHPKHRRRKKPYLVDNHLLGEKFKEHFCAGLKRLHRKGLIAFDPPVLPARVDEARDEPDFDEWLDRIAGQAWNVFIEPPPQNSQPQHMVKYLARYLTGGPISDGRLILHEQGEVTFWARSKNKQAGNQPRPFSLPGVEFVRRWSMHILPKGFTKTRCYGGFSCRHRQDYLQRCRQLLQIAEPEDEPQSPPPEDESRETTRTCPRCQAKMVCVTSTPRPSWRDLFADHATCPLWYQPLLSIPRRTISEQLHSRIRDPDPLASATACTL
jgi:hypothetical protein